MKNGSVEKSEATFGFLKSIMVYLTLFAYFNAFIMPLSPAMANDNEGDHSAKGVLIKHRFAEETEQLFKQMNKHPDIVKSRKIAEGMRGLKTRLDKALALDTEEAQPILFNSTFSDENLPSTPEEKFGLVQDVLTYMSADSRANIIFLNRSYAIEQMRVKTLKGIRKDARDLEEEFESAAKQEDKTKESFLKKAKWFKKFNRTLERDTRFAKVSRKYLSDSMDDERSDRAVHRNGLEELDALPKTKENLTKADRILKRSLRQDCDTLPEHIMRLITKAGLNRSFTEELMESSSWVVSWIGKGLNALTNKGQMKKSSNQLVRMAGNTLEVLSRKDVQLGLFGLAFLTSLPLAHGQMTVANRLADIGYNKDVPTVYNPPLIISNAAGNMIVGNSGIGTPAWAGNTTHGPIPAGVTVTYTSPPSPSGYHGLTITGNATAINDFFQTLTFVPVPGYRGTTDQISGSIYDGTTNLLVRRLLNPNFWPYIPPVVPPCSTSSTSPLTEGGTVPLTSTECPVSSPNGATNGQITMYVSATGGFFNFVSNPTQSALNFTFDDVVQNRIQFTSAGNVQPIGTLDVCDPYNCSTTSRAITFPFSATLQETDVGQLIEIIVPTVIGAIISIIGIWIIVHYVKKRGANSLSNFSEAAFVIDEMKLDIPDLEEGNGVVFKSLMLSIVNKLNEHPTIQYSSMTQGEKEGFLTGYIIPRIKKAEGIDYKVNDVKFIHRHGKMKLVMPTLELQNVREKVAANIVDDAIQGWAKHNNLQLVTNVTYPPAFQQDQDDL